MCCPRPPVRRAPRPTALDKLKGSSFGADEGSVDSRPPVLHSLFPLVNRHFQSFAEAADTVLEVLARSLPGTVAIGRVDAEDRLCRISDLRGEPTTAIERRGLLPLGANGHELDAGALADHGVAASLSLPIELSDGSLVGIVCAISPAEGAYRTEHVIMLGLAARLLSYEWERVKARAELRRLRQELRGDSLTDGDTGLLDRAAFGAHLDREWRLAQRGTLGSGVLVCRLHTHADRAEAEGAQSRLALKDAAGVLAAVARSTDHVGRVGPQALAVVMVGTEDEAGAEALQRRLVDALRRVTGLRQAEIAVGFGFAALRNAPSAEEALAVAERASERAEPVAASPQAEVL